ncbi:MAG: ribulose phosphate epimerase [Myxococcales bacterium]|nr:ribulose phosphate epimerase [Myxococcales bacterium]
MKQCIECDRHLFGPEPECPFCGASQPTAGASLGPVAVLTLAFGLGLASCGPTITEDPSDTSGADSSGTTEPGATSAMTTVAMTSGTSTTTDGTTAASDDVDDSQDDAPCGFYAGCPPEDWGPIDFECDIFAQDCPPGEKCMPWANDGSDVWNATRCSPIADNPGGVGDPCSVEGSGVSGIDDCALGHMCWDVDPETNTGDCIAMCTGTPDDPVCADGQQCSISNDGALALCLTACNPLTQDCADGQGCYATPQGGFICSGTLEPGAWGDDCWQFADCDPGSLCIDASVVPDCTSGACCSPLCDLTIPDTCPGIDQGVTCEPWLERAPPGYEDVGICVAL